MELGPSRPFGVRVRVQESNCQQTHLPPRDGARETNAPPASSDTLLTLTDGQVDRKAGPRGSR